LIRDAIRFLTNGVILIELHDFHLYKPCATSWRPAGAFWGAKMTSLDFVQTHLVIGVSHLSILWFLVNLAVRDGYPSANFGTVVRHRYYDLRFCSAGTVIQFNPSPGNKAFLPPP
jgi:hypothetical protein